MLSDAEEAAASRRQWQFWVLILALVAASVAYRILEYGELKQTSLMFIGIPALLAAVMVMLPKAKSGLDLVLTTTTLFMLLSAIVLGEGAICILMASPVVYFVVLVVFALLKWATRKRNSIMSVAVVGLVLPLALEGVTPGYSFDRAELVTVRQLVAAKPREVRRAVSAMPDFSKDVPTFLRMGFPQPVASGGEGLAVGDRRSVRFAGGEGEPGDLVLEVVRSEPGLLVFRPIRDDSHIGTWLRWKSATIRWNANPQGGTEVSLALAYDRGLDPAWYFGPWERYGVELAAQHVVARLLAPLSSPSP